MASLWNKLTSRKSFSDILGSKNKALNSSESDGARPNSEFPAYDPANPEHSPECRGRQQKTARESPSLRKLRSWSPSKLSDSMRSRYHSRSRSPSATRSKLGALAGTMKSAATFFYSQEEPPTTEFPAQEQLSPNSAKSLSSKKSVRFRSSHSFIDANLVTAPALPEIDVDGAFSFDNEITGQEPTSSPQKPKSPYLKELSIRIPQLAQPSGMSANLAPMPTTPMFEIDIAQGNPFDDSEAISAESARALEEYAGEFQDDRRISLEPAATSHQREDAISADEAALGLTTQVSEDDTQSKNEDSPFDGEKCPESLSNPFLSEALENTESKSRKSPSSLRVESASTDAGVTEKSQPEANIPADLSPLTRRSETRPSSQQYDADNDSSDIDEHEGHPEIMDSMGQPSPQIYVSDLDPFSSIPNIRVRSPASDEVLETTPYQANSYSGGHLGLLLAPENRQSTLSLGSSCSTDILSIDRSDDARDPRLCNGLRPDENREGSDKENRLGFGSRHASPVDPVKMGGQANTDSNLASNPTQKVLFDTVYTSPLNLIPTVSGISPARRSPPFRYTNSTDEGRECEHIDPMESSLSVRSAAEDVKYRHSGHALSSDGPLFYDTPLPAQRTPSPALIPLPPTVLPIRTKNSTLDSAAGVLPVTSSSKVWSALDEPDFAIVAHTMMQMHSEDFNCALRTALSETEIQELYRTVSEMAQNSSMASETTRREVIRRRFELMNQLRRGDISSLLSESAWLSKFSERSDRQEYSGEVSTQNSSNGSPSSLRCVSAGSDGAEGGFLLEMDPLRPFELSSSVSERTGPPNTPENLGTESSPRGPEQSSGEDALVSGKEVVERGKTDSSEEGDYGSGSHEQFSLLDHDFLSGFRKGSAGEAASV